MTYADVGGCKEQIQRLREVVELPLLHVRRGGRGAESGEERATSFRQQLLWINIFFSSSLTSSFSYFSLTYFFFPLSPQPERFVSLGIDPPKGVLMYGPPGTGKTVWRETKKGFLPFPFFFLLPPPPSPYLSFFSSFFFCFANLFSSSSLILSFFPFFSLSSLRARWQTVQTLALSV